MRSLKQQTSQTRSHPQTESLEEPGTSKCSVFSLPYVHIFSHDMVRKFSSRKIAHAQTKYQENNISGRGARASYQTMFPVISAR